MHRYREKLLTLIHKSSTTSAFHLQRLTSMCLVVALGMISLTGCGKKQTFEDYLNEVFLDEVTANTINLHYTIENPKTYGIKNYDISLGSFSTEGQEDYVNSLKKMKLELMTFPYTSLTTEEQLTYDIFNDYLDSQLALSSFYLYDEPLSYSNGMQLQVPILMAEYEFNCERDVKDYLELLQLLDEYLESMISFEKEKSAAWLFMSDELCQRVIDSCEAFLENPDNHYMLTTFENRLKDLKLSDKEKSKYIASNRRIFEKQIVPAYKNLIKELNSLLGTGENNYGVCHFPNGKKYYEHLVYSETGCSDSIQEIFNHIEAQRMKDLVVCADLQEKDPTLIEQCAYLEWNMDDETEMLSHLQDKMLIDFPAAPMTEYTIHHVDPALQDYLAPAFYIVAPIDNYLDNAIYVNDASEGSDIYYFTTLAHEGFPGHLYQTVMSYEYELLPIRNLLSYCGYTEGWATYVEMISYYYSELDDDIASLLSHNQSATLSLYATSDIGLHYMEWTAEDMYNFWSSYGISDQDTINEITQLILSEPGNYLNYYVGYLEFLELRDYAKEQLGSDYSTVAFHRTLLDIGPAPFDIIEEYFKTYYSCPQT